MRVNLPTVIGLVAVVGAGAFAAGQSTAPAVAVSPASPPAAAAAMPTTLAESDEPLPPGHPPMGAGGVATGAGTELPPGHPPVDPMALTGAPMTPGAPSAASSSLEWKAPARWQSVPNTSTMRLATFRIPRAPGDTEDAELSITQAGGSVDANAERWIGQFDAASQKTAKRSARKVGSLEVAMVEASGTMSGGMGMGADARPTTGRALLGAIVSTPGMPHFFKLTGPKATVLAARAELDEMLASLVVR